MQCARDVYTSLATDLLSRLKVGQTLGPERNSCCPLLVAECVCWYACSSSSSSPAQPASLHPGPPQATAVFQGVTDGFWILYLGLLWLWSGNFVAPTICFFITTMIEGVVLCGKTKAKRASAA